MVYPVPVSSAPSLKSQEKGQGEGGGMETKGGGKEETPSSPLIQFSRSNPKALTLTYSLHFLNPPAHLQWHRHTRSRPCHLRAGALDFPRRARAEAGSARYLCRRSLEGLWQDIAR